MRFRAFHWLFLAGALLLVVAACSSPKPQPPAPESPFRPTSTIKDIMDSEVDPSADYLWDSVATLITRAGTEEKQPRTDAEWKLVRQKAITLVEATNLLVMDGRHVAKQGEKPDNPGIELTPEEIQQIVDGDRVSFIKFAHALNDAAMLALKAVDAKNPQALSDAGAEIDEACENCHLKYWYPPAKPAAEAKSTKS